VELVPTPGEAMPPAEATVVIGATTAYGTDRAWLIRPDGYIASSRELRRS
jgi:hypothetical protein